MINSLSRLVIGILNLDEIMKIMMLTPDGLLEGIRLISLIGGILTIFFKTYEFRESWRFYAE